MLACAKAINWMTNYYFTLWIRQTFIESDASLINFAFSPETRTCQQSQAIE